jgi:hypothetical protein
MNAPHGPGANNSCSCSTAGLSISPTHTLQAKQSTTDLLCSAFAMAFASAPGFVDFARERFCCLGVFLSSCCDCVTDRVTDTTDTLRGLLAQRGRWFSLRHILC